MGQRAALVAQSSHAALEHAVVCVATLRLDQTHGQIALDALEHWAEFRLGQSAHVVVLGPVLEDLGRQALAQVDVVHGAAAHGPPADHANREVGCGASAAVLVQERHHLVLALGHVAGAE